MFISSKILRGSALTWVAAVAGLLSACASPDMATNGEVVVVTASELPPPSAADLIGGTRAQLFGPGDVLSVEVLGLSDISRQVRVDSAGNIALPLAGTVSVMGESAVSLGRTIERQLSANFVRDPRVTVSIQEIVSQNVTVEGEVEKPGIYPIAGEMTLMRAVARAEGTSDFAQASRVVVFRKVDGREMAALYDLRAIRLGYYKDPEIFAHDVVVVDESRARRIFPLIAQASSLLLTPLVAFLNNSN